MEIYSPRRLWRSDRSLCDIATPQVFVHASHAHFATVRDDKHKIFRILEGWSQEHGLKCQLVRGRPQVYEDAKNSQHLHVFFAGRPVSGRHVIHLCPTYIFGYWYLDHHGTREASSIRNRDFDPDSVASKAAKTFQADLRTKFVDQGRTKYAQSTAGTHPLETGGILVLAQDFKPTQTADHYLSFEQILKTVIAHRGDRPVYIKPHPLQKEEQTQLIATYHAPDDNVHVVNANIFDLLKACAYNVSICSAAAFEGFILNKPAIIAAPTDFHHNSMTAKSTDELAAAMQNVTGQPNHHAEYLSWFLRRNCIHPADKSTKRKLAAAIAETGFAPAQS